MAHRKNSELLARPNAPFLTSLEKQRLYVLRILGSPRGCPNCHFHLNFFDAAGVAVDDFDLSKCSTDDAALSCPECKRGLRYVVPFVGDWFFDLIPEVDRFHKIGAKVVFDFPTGRGDQRCAGFGKVVGIAIDGLSQATYDVDVGAGEVVGPVLAKHLKAAP